MILLNALVLRIGRLDSIRWNADKSGLFTVVCTYKWNVLSSKDISKVARFISKNVAPLKA